ncbi:uncharacterized protein LOC112468714, partial [Temnothorax curvispinosus]|uniref:Uncharacterized protein LOC112468714 n=1 Tax=Temnothorax curvispinosus TaxID=300111 RepID=A0A6J1RHG8_9HYME
MPPPLELAVVSGPVCKTVALIPRHQAFSSMMEDKLNQLNINTLIWRIRKDKEEMKRLQKENAKLRQLAAIQSPSPLSELLVRNAQAVPSTTPAPPAAPTPAQLPATPTTSRNSCLPPEKPKRWQRAGRNRSMYTRGRGRGERGRGEKGRGERGRGAKIYTLNI